MQSRDELIEKLVEHMALVQRHMRVRRSSAWLDLDLTRQQAKTLHFLTDGQRRMSEIAGRLDVEMPSATSMIDRLVAKGLVERGQDPTDRRAVVCSLTQEGIDTVERFSAIRAARTESLAAVLSTEELEVVVPAMEILADAVRRPDFMLGSDGRESPDGTAQTVEAGA